MRFAIFSDLHDLSDGLNHVLRDAEQRQADRLLYLGDVGRDPALFERLRAAGIACIFGNWEVSGYRRLPDTLTDWVANWPATLRHDDVIFSHATPDMPPNVATTTDAARVKEDGTGWLTLFPLLHQNEEARWQALAALETDGLHAAFHGHTHIQAAWRYTKQAETRRWHALATPGEFALDPADATDPARYLIGVGSAGAPQDGAALRYALYDNVTRVITLIALDAKTGAATGTR